MSAAGKIGVSLYALCSEQRSLRGGCCSADWWFGCSFFREWGWVGGLVCFLIWRLGSGVFQLASGCFCQLMLPALPVHQCGDLQLCFVPSFLAQREQVVENTNPYKSCSWCEMIPTLVQGKCFMKAFVGGTLGLLH